MEYNAEMLMNTINEVRTHNQQKRANVTYFPSEILKVSDSSDKDLKKIKEEQNKLTLRIRK